MRANTTDNKYVRMTEQINSAAIVLLLMRIVNIVNLEILWRDNWNDRYKLLKCANTVKTDVPIKPDTLLLKKCVDESKQKTETPEISPWKPQS